MFKKMKEIFNKSNYDYSKGYVDPLKFHSTVFFFSKAYGMYNETGSIAPRCILLFMFVFCAIPALIVSGLSTYQGFRNNFNGPQIIEAGAYFIVMSYKVCILSCTKLNVHEFKAFFRSLNEDFMYVSTDGKKYRERFFQNQLMTWKICICVAIFMSAIGFGMVMFAVLALVFYLANHDPQSDGKRPLPFPYWFFDTDFGKSPTYEMALIFSNICVLAYCFNYIFMIETQILWVREIATKADLVIWGIQDLMDGIYPATNKREADIFASVIKYRMRAIIQQHHSMHDLLGNYARVHKKFLMFEQTFCGPVVCLTAYSAAEKLDDGEVHTILILLCVAAITVAFVPSYLCTFLKIKGKGMIASKRRTNEDVPSISGVGLHLCLQMMSLAVVFAYHQVSSVVHACWDTPFWNSRPVIRPYLVLIIQRSQRPLPLSFGGFQEVSLQTFSNKMTSAYSLFNMLRQSIK